MWLKEGDKNTKFFHKMANAHKRRNHLKRIRINGEWFNDENDLRNEVLKAFQGLLSTDNAWHPNSNALSFDSLDPSEAARLESPFTKEEIFVALGDFSGDKALGPDGFTMAFSKNS